MKFRFGCPAWGEHYVGLFLDYGLPSQLAALEGFDGNLSDDCTYTIYTFRADYKRMVGHWAIDKLTKIMNVNAFILDDAFAASPQMNARLPAGSTNNLVGLRIVHGMQVVAAAKEEAAIFFLQADQIWSNGAFTKAMRMISAGRRAVLCAGPRVVNSATVRTQLRAMEGIYEPRALMKLAFGDGIHPETETWFWDSGNYNQYATYMLFHAPGGVLCHGWVYHPLVVYPHPNRYKLNFNIFDQDFLAEAINPSEAYVVDNSDDICQISLAPRHILQLQSDHNPYLDPIVAAVWYASKHYQKFHTELFNVAVRLHWEADNYSDWASTYTRVGEIRTLINEVILADLEWLAEYHPEVCLRQMDNHAFRGPGEAYPEAVRERALRVKELRRHREWHPPTDGKEKADEVADVVSGVGGPAP